jgi:cell division protein FtsB
MGFGFVWWQRQELNELAAQRDKMAAEVSKLREEADESRRGSSSKRLK